MRQGSAAQRRGHGPWARRRDDRADEARLAPLLERTYAARAARLAPTDDALRELNVALDAISTPARRRTNHPRLLGVCAFVVLLLLLIPIARSEFTARTRVAPQPAVTATSAAVGGESLPAAAASAAPTVTDRAPAANGTAATTGVSETPLRDLLARAGIRASEPGGGSTDER